MLTEEKRLQRNAYQREWARRNPEKMAAIQSKANAKWRAKDPEHADASSKRWRESNPQAPRWQHIKSRFGMTREQWIARFEAQGQCCAICRSPDPKSKKGWNTDHDHRSEQVLPKPRGRGRQRHTEGVQWQLTVRGILCQPCNIGLGGFDDNLITLANAGVYLDPGAARVDEHY